MKKERTVFSDFVEKVKGERSITHVILQRHYQSPATATATGGPK